MGQLTYRSLDDDEITQRGDVITYTCGYILWLAEDKGILYRDLPCGVIRKMKLVDDVLRPTRNKEK